MKVAMAFVFALAVTMVAVAFVQAESYSQSKSPRDEPNFKPVITKETVDGREVETIEFRSRLAG